MIKHKDTHTFLLAARQGNVEQFNQLITLHGSSLINSQDELGTSALHLAVMHGHEDIVKLLLSQPEIDPNLQAYKLGKKERAYSPLDMAIKYDQPIEMVRLLLTSGASTQYPTSLLMMLLERDFNKSVKGAKETVDYTPFERMIEILEALVQNLPSFPYLKEIPLVFPFYQMNCFISVPKEKWFMEKMIDIILKHDVNHYTKEFLIAKNFTHAFPSNHQYQSINMHVKSLVAAEGHFSSLTVKSFHESIHELEPILELDPTQFSIANYHELKISAYGEVKKAMYIAEKAILNAGLYEVSEMLFHLYEQDVTLLLPSGWQGHTVEIILDKSLGLYVVANSGDRHPNLPSGVKAYNNGSPISADDIFKILNNSDQFNLEYDHYYSLSLEKNPVFSKEFPNQIYGNCAHNSLILANWSILYIHLYKTVNNPELAKQLADSWYQDITEHHKTTVLKNYLSNPYFKTDKPLYDALIKYEAKLDHPEKIKQAQMIVDYLSSPEHISGFKHFLKKHHQEFSAELKDFVHKNTYGQALHLNDVLTNTAAKPFLELEKYQEIPFAPEFIRHGASEEVWESSRVYADIYI